MLFCLFFIVGDGAPDVPLIDVSVSISFVFFYTMFGAKIYNIVCFFSFVTNPSPAASMLGCRGRQPLHICVYSLSAAKSLSLFAGFTLFNGIGKSGAEIFSPTPLYYFFYCCVLFYFSAPLEHNSGQLCSFLTPHLPHSSLTPPLLLPFPLQALRTLQVLH